ncbi:unnamed protein product [Sphagnum troendelagicum]|uniref:Uncharacterized protein n=1 Tax=Sphagnum troendelagicum TaxID=128251 RepID=A0ABP0U5Z4_9BRYO
MTVLEQGVKELMQKLEETCTEMQQGAENHICEGGSKLMLQLLQYYVEITPRRKLLAISVVLDDALGGDSRGASGMMMIIRCRRRATW